MAGFGTVGETMKIAVMGSGGVGGYFGARLAKGGADVHFVARGAHLAAMRRDGIAIEGGPDPIQVPRVSATDEPTRHRHRRPRPLRRQAVGYRRTPCG